MRPVRLLYLVHHHHQELQIDPPAEAVQPSLQELLEAHVQLHQVRADPQQVKLHYGMLEADGSSEPLLLLGKRYGGSELLEQPPSDEFHEARVLEMSRDL